MIAMFLLMVGGALILTLSERHIEEVECYDRAGSEIQGLTCDREVITNKLNLYLGIGMASIGIIGMILNIVFLPDIDGW